MYNIKKLENGLTIVAEYIPYVKSVSFGVWVNNGSRYENINESGISHFIEHMLFKGTKNRSSKQLAESIDRIGGQINAFTGKENTCYYTKTLDSHIDISIDVLSDMLFNSLFTKKDINIEKKVIFEEINMYEDSPEDVANDLLMETVWAKDSLGQPILGTYDTLNNISKDTIMQYYKSHYCPSNTVIAIAGNFDYDIVIEKINKHFGNWENSKIFNNSFENADYSKDIVFKKKDIEQAHLCVGFKGIEHGNDDIYTLLLINTIFGGGMSSMLFQNIREKKGLCYSIYSYSVSYQNAGLFTIYTGLNPSKTTEVIKLIGNEIESLKKNKLTEEEIYKGREQLKGNIILGMESVSSRMSSIGKSVLTLGKIKTPEEVLKKCDEIDINSVDRLINKIFDKQNLSFSLVGSVPKNTNFYDLFDF